MSSLIHVIDSRTGERLIQALILHASQEQVFRDEFADWLGFEELGVCTRFREEVKDQTRRYDLVLEFGKTERRNVELKLHADFTEEQNADLSAGSVGAIHAVVVPEYRLDELRKNYGKEGLVVRTWEEFAQGPARSTPASLVLFDKMLEYVHGVEYLSVAQVANGVQLWQKRRWASENDYGLLHRFLVRMRYETKQRYPDLTVGPVRPSPKKLFYGFLVRPKKGTGAIWVGLVAVPQEDWQGFYVQADGTAQEILGLREVSQEDRWWSVYEAGMGRNAERIPPDGHGRYVLKKVERAFWKRLDILE